VKNEVEVSTNVLNTLESVNGIHTSCIEPNKATRKVAHLRFTFNEEQHRYHCGSRVVSFVENESIEEEDEEFTDLQQLCFYHGKGGSGKSHLIRAFTALADSGWSRSSGVQFLLAPASQL
jgi:hypothetical protein